MYGIALNNENNKQLLQQAIAVVTLLLKDVEANIQRVDTTENHHLILLQKKVASMENLLNIFIALQNGQLINDDDFQKIEYYCRANKISLDNFFAAFTYVVIDENTPLTQRTVFYLNLNNAATKALHEEVYKLLLASYAQCYKQSLPLSRLIHDAKSKFLTVKSIFDDAIKMSAPKQKIKDLQFCYQQAFAAFNELQIKQKQLMVKLQLTSNMCQMLSSQKNCWLLEKTKFNAITKEIKNYPDLEKLINYLSLFKERTISCAQLVPSSKILPPSQSIYSLSERINRYFTTSVRINDISGQYSPLYKTLFRRSLEQAKQDNCQFEVLAKKHNLPAANNGQDKLSRRSKELSG